MKYHTCTHEKKRIADCTRRFALAVTLTALSFSGSATVYTVNSLATTNTGSGNSGTLYYCISQANFVTGPHTINFSVAGTIAISSPSSVLPALVKEITIDGSTAPGYAGTPVVILDGTGLTGGDGLSINAANCRIYGLDITNFPYSGIDISSASNGFQIGGSGKGNVIRNNGYYGIQVTSADNGKIAYNKIGTDPTGMTCAMNQYDGIDLNTGANNDTIMNNQISCNGYNGIQIGGSNNNVVRGNLIGPLLGQCTGSGYRGVDIEDGSTGNIIGGPSPADFNKIAGNLYWGIEVKTANTINNVISGNSYSCNDYGAIDVNTGGNNNIAPPVISTANTTTIAGTAMANAIIELFKSQNTNPSLCSSTPSNQGVDYIGTVTANGTGSWSMSGTFSGYVTATQRDANGNTSEFSTAMYTGAVGSLSNSCSGNVITALFTNPQPEIPVLVYPNPSRGSFTVELTVTPGATVTIEVLNMLGEVMETRNPENRAHLLEQVELHHAPAGMYYLRIRAGNVVLVKKMVIE
jgi:parallel beta-helix repeat protein